MNVIFLVIWNDGVIVFIRRENPKLNFKYSVNIIGLFKNSNLATSIN